MTDQSSRIDALHERFGIPGLAAVTLGNGGLPKICITSPLATAEMYLHGAHLTAWRPAGAEEAIFVSRHSHWQDGTAIRGGVPICFPWFRSKADDPKAPSHGFARIKEWQLDAITAGDDGAVVVTCSTASDETTRRWWPHEFHLAHTIIVGTELTMQLTMTNADSTPLQFEEALHTYFSVDHVGSVRVQGLDQAVYLDNADGGREKIQSGEITFAAETDNAYLHTESAVDLIDPVKHRRIRTSKHNSMSTVVWNPGPARAAALADLGDDEWPSMTCVEAANILGEAVSLAPGEQHRMQVTLSIMPE